MFWKCIRWRQRRRTARAHMPEFCAQIDSDVADGTFSPGLGTELRRVEFHAVVAAGHDHRQQARMHRILTPPAMIGRPVNGRIRATRAGRSLAVLPRGAGECSVSHIHEQTLPEAGRITLAQ